MTGATKLSPTIRTHEDILANLKNRSQVKTTPQQKTEESQFANISENVFFKTMFDDKTSPNEKAKQVAKELTFTASKEVMKNKVKQLEDFKEFLQTRREEMAKKIIEVTNTEAFSELKKNFDELNGALLEFNELIKPLTDITDAVYTLRTNDATYDIFKEIKQDREAEAILSKEKDQLNHDLNLIKQEVDAINLENAALSQKRGWFGLGGVPLAEKQAIAQNDLRLNDLRSRLVGLESRALELNSKQGSTDSEFAQFANEKAKIRELIDISSDGHKERQKALVDAALNFVNTSKERIGSVRKHLGSVGNQVDNLGEAANKMTMVYATLNEAIKLAESENQKVRESLEKPADADESLIDKLDRENRQTEVLGYVALLDQSKVDTQVTFSDLVGQSTRIKTMKDATVQQENLAKNLHTQGVAGVADRISVVLQAVSSAALGESSAVAKDTIRLMTESTNKTAQKESIRVAMGINDVNDDIINAMKDLESYSEITKAATQITHDGVTALRGHLSELEKIAQGAETSLRENIAVHSDVYSGTTKTEVAPEKKTPDVLGF
jgi:hypothetical protein